MAFRAIRQMIAVAVLSMLASAATVTPGSGRVAVSPEQIADAMQSAGFATTVDQLQMLTNATSVAGAKLRVAKVTPQSPDTALAQLICPARQCLPFYVLVHDARVASSPKPLASPSPVDLATKHPLIARGKPVTLLIENANLRIVLPAISLESGAHGQVIKVSSPDHKRKYKAEVVSATLVRSQF